MWSLGNRLPALLVNFNCTFTSFLALPALNPTTKMHAAFEVAALASLPLILRRHGHVQLAPVNHTCDRPCRNHEHVPLVALNNLRDALMRFAPHTSWRHDVYSCDRPTIATGYHHKYTTPSMVASLFCMWPAVASRVTYHLSRFDQNAIMMHTTEHCMAIKHAACDILNPHQFRAIVWSLYAVELSKLLCVEVVGRWAQGVSSSCIVE